MDIDPHLSPVNDHLLEQVTDAIATTGEDDVHAASITHPGHERWTKLPKPRGRQPKDPNAQSVRFPCRGVEDLERQLKEYLKAPTTPAEHTTLEFVFPVSAAFMVYTADFRNQRNTKQSEKQHFYGKLDRSAVSVIDALAPAEDSKDRMRKQKAIAKICVEACERADGFRYSFHNNWLSREDEACRFSYFCNDSTLNKGRAANEGAGSVGKKMRKPVYDCQGLIAIKFSQTKQSLEVQYKHIALHKTYAERAPPPRRDSKRYKLMEIFNPEALRETTKRRSRLSTDDQDASNERQAKRRAPELSINPEVHQNAEIARDNGLHPLVEFLHSVPNNRESAPSHVPLTVAAESPLNSSPKSSSDRTTQAQQSQRTVVSRPRRPALPGTLSGALQSGSLTWAESTSENRKKKQKNDPLRGIAEAASNAIPLSELDALKAKLEEAEQRIRRLEAEKEHAPPVHGHSQPPPVWPGYPPPHHYPYPYPPPPNYPLPPQALSPHAYVPYPHPPQPAPPHWVHGPQRKPLPQALDPSQPAVQPAVPPAVQPAVQPATPVPRKKGATKEKPNVRAFVAYTPKPQKPVLEAQRQDSLRTRPRNHNPYGALDDTTEVADSRHQNPGVTPQGGAYPAVATAVAAGALVSPSGQGQYTMSHTQSPLQDARQSREVFDEEGRGDDNDIMSVSESSSDVVAADGEDARIAEVAEGD